MSKSKLEISKAEGPHLRLASIVGNWEGECSTWFEKDVLADQSAMRAKIVFVMDDRFISYEYEGTLNGKPYEGRMLCGYDLSNQKCQMSWIDTFHMGTGIMHCEGNETSSGFSVSGTYGGEGMPEPWAWRTELEIVNSEQLVIRAYNISPDGDEAKAMETSYRRIKY